MKESCILQTLTNLAEEKATVYINDFAQFKKSSE